jgi:hypothetical protein
MQKFENGDKIKFTIKRHCVVYKDRVGVISTLGASENQYYILNNYENMCGATDGHSYTEYKNQWTFRIEDDGYTDDILKIELDYKNADDYNLHFLKKLSTGNFQK